MPFPDSQLHGQIQALPTHFTADIPRRQYGTRAYCLITDNIEYKGNVLHDSEMDWGVYLHERLPGQFSIPTEKSTITIDKHAEVPEMNGKQMQLFES